MTMRREELQGRADAIRWFHTLDLGQGVRTRGRYEPSRRMDYLKLPPVAGKTILDVGAWDGGYSFEMERRGAARILATDHWCWGGPGWGTKEGFDLAHEAYGSRVEAMEIDPHELSAERVGRFDVVLFLGVLYHVKDPLTVLERIFDVTGDLLVLETEVDMLFSRRPVAAFYEADAMAGDETNYWGPNPRAVVAMLREVGFREARAVSRHSIARIAARAVVRHARDNDRLLDGLRRDRMVFHARR